MNLGIHKAAIQSSFSQYSALDDPLRAVSGLPTGSFSFHTGFENDPWWLLDLGGLCKIEKILVYNRADGAQHRARHFNVEIFDPAHGGWKSIYAAENEFGGFRDNSPLRLSFGSTPKLARYIKFSTKGYNCLHLDQVEVFGTSEQRDYESILDQRLATFHTDAGDGEYAAPEPSGLGAIVGLVRGYDELGGYDALIARNAAIFEAINKHRSAHYPLLIWHEGNIPPEHQVYILSKEQNRDVRFLDISDRFRLPPDVARGDFKEGWGIGYRLMCKFNSFDIWELTKQFNYILRIDEDCVLSEIVTDPFAWMSEANLDCAFSWLIDDNHDLTNETLPIFAEAFVTLRQIKSDAVVPLTSCFPYTNVMIARTKFFRKKDVQEFLSFVVGQPEFYINRWGDHIVLGIPLNLYSSFDKIQPILGLSYRHHSHNLTVVANDDHRMRVRKRNNRDKISLLDGLTGEDYERTLLALYAEWPIDQALRSRLIELFEATGRHAVADRLRPPKTTRWR